MSEVIAELIPVFLLIAVGYGVRAANIISAEAFGQVNRFGYFVLYPAFLFTLTSTADLTAGVAGPFVMGLLLGFVRRLRLRKPGFHPRAVTCAPVGT